MIGPAVLSHRAAVGMKLDLAVDNALFCGVNEGVPVRTMKTTKMVTEVMMKVGMRMMEMVMAAMTMGMMGMGMVGMMGMMGMVAMTMGMMVM